MSNTVDNSVEIAARMMRLARAEERSMDLALTIDERRAAEDERQTGERTGYGPLVGMPVGVPVGSDIYAGEVVAVSPSGHQVMVRYNDGEPEKFTRRTNAITVYQTKGRAWGHLRFLRTEPTKLDPSF